MSTRADQKVSRVWTIQVSPTNSCTFHRQGLSKIQVWETRAQKDSNPHISVSARPKTQMRIGEFHAHLLALTREADKTLGGGIDRLR